MGLCLLVVGKIGKRSPAARVDNDGAHSGFSLNELLSTGLFVAKARYELLTKHSIA